MKKYWDKVEVGHTLNPIKKPPLTRGQIAQFSTASYDCSPLHLDDDYAKNAGFNSAFSSGLICLAFVEESLHAFAKNMQITSMSGTFQRLIWPGDCLMAKGVIVRRYQKNGEFRIQLDVWCENQNGDVVMKGSAQCALFKNPNQEEESKQQKPAISAINHEALVKKYERLTAHSEQAQKGLASVKETA